MSARTPVRVAVIGAGLAGAAFALRLAQRASDAAQITLIERSAWPRAKVCGCCLNEGAVRCLEQLGFGEWCRDAGVVVDRVL
ncbi:MAG: FAD-dependent monooxygenase, partial [Phycisphaerales bacterium]|nr:FAD-dependent monooxygenase [Phycisphaerales bacterium]